MSIKIYSMSEITGLSFDLQQSFYPSDGDLDPL